MYRLVWWQPALTRFEEQYDRLPAADKRRVMDALDTIDRLLMNQPMATGESRESDSRRVLVYPPLAIEYRVEHRLQQVTIYGAKLYPEA